MSLETVLNLKSSVLADNDRDAALLRSQLLTHNIIYFNLMSSPGSGKTSVLLQLLPRLKGFETGVMEADIDSDVDAVRLRKAGYRSVQLHTGGMCHLDADMSRQGIRKITAGTSFDFTSPLSVEKDPEGKKLILFLENVGNLVCPAEFDTGAHENLCILSIPEGDDKPLKYPRMFRLCNTVILNKWDAAPAFDFDFRQAADYIRDDNPEAVIFPVSAKTGEGFDPLAAHIRELISRWNETAGI